MLETPGIQHDRLACGPRGHPHPDLARGAAASPGQQPAHVPQMGILTGGAALDTFRHGLRDLGYTEGQSIALAYRAAEESGSGSQISPPRWCD
jgi:hypothetical protein